MNAIVYFLGIFSALSAFILSFPFYDEPIILLSSCLLILISQYIIHEVMKDKKIFYTISILISMICLVLSFSGLFYIKDVILKKYMEESIYTFYIVGEYNYYEQFFKVFITMLSLTLPLNTLNIYVFSQKKYILSIFILFPFIFVEVLFTITPPFYCIPYILYCMIAILSHHQSQIQMIPLGLSICFLLGLFYFVPPTEYTHPRKKEIQHENTIISTPSEGNQYYDLMEQGNRYYTNRVELKISGITNKSFKLRGNVYDYFNGTWSQTTNSTSSHYPYVRNIQVLGRMFECENKKITVTDNYHHNLVYVPYFFSSSSKSLQYYHSHFEGNKDEDFEIIIPDEQWDDYLNLSDEEKNDMLYTGESFSFYETDLIADDNIPYDTYQVLDKFMTQHHLYDYDDVQDLITKARKAIQDETKYSLTPGITPSDENFFDYFLNKNKKGYCVHYASTLALILRMNGYPAHFVTGYQVNGSQSYDDYTVVLDSSSHAWVEITDPILGYIPIEATPASAIQTYNNPVNDGPVQAPTQQQSNNTQQQITTTLEADKEDFQIPLYIYPICIVVLIVLLIYLQSRIRFKRQWIHLDNNQKVCSMYYRFQRLNIGVEEEMIQLCKKAKFSSHQLTDDEYLHVLSYYNETLYSIYKKSSLFHKMKLKIIYAYI